MVSCEVCGKGVAKHTALIEGAKFQVCERCAQHGKILNKQSSNVSVTSSSGTGNVNVQKSSGTKTSAFKSGRKDINQSYNMREEIVDNYAEIIRKEFNRSGKTYKDFANNLNENESYMRKIIRGEMMPTIATAKKLEKAYNIKLIEESESGKINLKGSGSGDLTLGDLVEIKKKK